MASPISPLPPNTQLVYGTPPGGVPNGQPLHLLDMITFRLSSVFLTQTLKSITVTDMGSGSIIPGVTTPGLTSRVFLAGLVVQNAVPEPGPLTLAAVSTLVVRLFEARRRRRHPAR